MANPAKRLEAGGATVFLGKLTREEKGHRVRARMWDEADAEEDARAKAEASSGATPTRK